MAFALATLALAAIAVAMLARSSHDRASGAAAIVEDTDVTGPGSPFEGATRPLSPPRDFALHNQDGRLMRSQDLRGKVVVVTPMYATCTDTCPLIAQQIRDALMDVGERDRSQIRALAISVDPAKDTPEQARLFLESRDVGDYLDFLVGDRTDLRPVWKAFGFSEQLDQLEHNAYVVLLDRKGRQRVGFPVQRMTPEALTHDLKTLVAEPRS